MEKWRDFKSPKKDDSDFCMIVFNMNEIHDNNFQINISKYAFRATGLILSRNYMYISTETLFSLKPSKEAFINAVIIPPKFRVEEVKRKVKEFMDNNSVTPGTNNENVYVFNRGYKIRPYFEEEKRQVLLGQTTLSDFEIILA